MLLLLSLTPHTYTHDADNAKANLLEVVVCAMPTALLYVPYLQLQASMFPL